MIHIMIDKFSFNKKVPNSSKGEKEIKREQFEYLLFIDI
jgi:hypothetical protein